MLLSLDIGFRATGWTVFKGGQPQACGVIFTNPAKGKGVRTSDDNAARAAQIALGLTNVVKAHGVLGVVGEMPSGGAQSAKAMSQMALATGTVAATFAVLGLPVEWAQPQDVKLAVCGTRSATKDEIMETIRERFAPFTFPKTKAEFEHIADSCGAYLALASGNLVRMFG
jgi:Holliday junction resolvasome RuvABC endonuclease subunit